MGSVGGAVAMPPGQGPLAVRKLGPELFLRVLQSGLLLGSGSSKLTHRLGDSRELVYWASKLLLQSGVFGALM